MTHSAAAVQQQDQESGPVYDDDFCIQIPNNYLQPDLIEKLKQGGSKAPLMAQLITTLFHAKKGGYSIASLVATQGGTRKYIAAVLQELERQTIVESTTAKIGSAAIWRLTPASKKALQEWDSKPQAIKGPSLKALHRLLPCRHDALIIRAQILVRIAFSPYHLNQYMEGMATEYLLTIDQQGLPYEDNYGDCQVEPLDVHADCPADKIRAALPGISDRTRREAVEQLIEAGLVLRRLGREGAFFALTQLGWEIVAAAPGELRPSPQKQAQGPGELRPSSGELRPSGAASYAHTPASYAHRAASYAHLEEGFRLKIKSKELDEGSAPLAALAGHDSLGEETFGQNQTQEQLLPLSMDQIQETLNPADAAMPHPPTPLPAAAAAAAAEPAAAPAEPAPPVFVPDWNQWDLQPGQQPSRWHNPDGTPRRAPAGQSGRPRLAKA